MFGSLAALWGFTGVFVLLSSAISRLAPTALALEFSQLSFVHWLALLFSLMFMGFAEGSRKISLRV